MDENKFLMWRTCFSIMRVDGKVTEDEREWAQDRLENLPFNETQRKQIEKEIDHPKENIMDLFDKISSPADKAFVLHMVRIIGNKDGDYSEYEKSVYNQLEEQIMANVNLPEVENLVVEMEEESTRANESVFDKIKRFLGNDD